MKAQANTLEIHHATTIAPRMRIALRNFSVTNIRWSWIRTEIFAIERAEVCNAESA